MELLRFIIGGWYHYRLDFLFCGDGGEEYFFSLLWQ